MKKMIAVGLLSAGSLLVAGCSRGAPAGQVAAKVNGQEVTLQEINTELQSSQVPPNADKQAVQRALLQRIIDRKLLVGAAQDKKLDKSPEFLAQRRRMDELLLAQAYTRQQLTAVPVPTPGEVDKFISEHRNVFGGREQLVLDQIRFPAPQDAKALEPLAQDHSLTAVAARLTSLGIKYERGNNTLDTANVPANVLDQINKLPAGEPFVVPQPGIVTVNVVTARRPIEMENGQIRQVATRAYREQKFADLLQQQLTSLKAGAKITYQNGFGPPADGAATPAGGAKPAK